MKRQDKKRKERNEERWNKGKKMEDGKENRI